MIFFWDDNRIEFHGEFRKCVLFSPNGITVGVLQQATSHISIYMGYRYIHTREPFTTNRRQIHLGSGSLFPLFAENVHQILSTQVWKQVWTKLPEINSVSKTLHECFVPKSDNRFKHLEPQFTQCSLPKGTRPFISFLGVWDCRNEIRKKSKSGYGFQILKFTSSWIHSDLPQGETSMAPGLDSRYTVPEKLGNSFVPHIFVWGSCF